MLKYPVVAVAVLALTEEEKRSPIACVAQLSASKRRPYQMAAAVTRQQQGICPGRRPHRPLCLRHEQDYGCPPTGTESPKSFKSMLDKLKRFLGFCSKFLYDHVGDDFLKHTIKQQKKIRPILTLGGL